MKESALPKSQSTPYATKRATSCDDECRHTFDKFSHLSSCWESGPMSNDSERTVVLSDE